MSADFVWREMVAVDVPVPVRRVSYGPGNISGHGLVLNAGRVRALQWLLDRPEGGSAGDLDEWLGWVQDRNRAQSQRFLARLRDDGWCHSWWHNRGHRRREVFTLTEPGRALAAGEVRVAALYGDGEVRPVMFRSLYVVLRALVDAEKPLTAAAVAGRTGVSVSTASALLAGRGRVGWVVRAADGWVLTARGRVLAVEETRLVLATPRPVAGCDEEDEP